MKKHLLFIIVALAFLLPGSALATIVYSDYSCTGCDTTGAGTYGDPYQTIEKATLGLTGGDEARVAKTGAHTAITGTLTFVNGSTTIATSVDLTGELSAGDYIGKDTANESWWRIVSLDATDITLAYEYWGAAGDFSAYILTHISWAGIEQDIQSSGTSSSSRLKITGGWDLSTQTRTGYTYVVSDPSGSTGIDADGESYLEIGYFGFGRFVYALRLWGGRYIDMHDLQFFGCSSYTLYVNSTDWVTASDIILSGGIGQGLRLITAAFGVYENLRFLSIGMGTGDYSILTDSGALANYFKTCSVYNTPVSGICLSSGVNIFEDLTVDTTAGAAVYLETVETVGTIFSNPTISNTSTSGFYSAACVGTRVHNATFSNIGSVEYNWDAASTRHLPIYYVSDHEGVAGDDFMVCSFGTIYRDTTDARSGDCLKFDPTTVDRPVLFKVGTYKVTSVASDLTLSVYLKDDVAFDGTVTLWATTTSQMAESYTLKTPTTSYVQNSIVVASADLVDEEYIHLWVAVSGTAGNVFVDDFSVSQ